MALPKIVLVSADEAFVTAIRGALGDAFEVIARNSARDGFKVLSVDKDVRVVVSDLHLPDVGGIAFLCKVLKDFPEVIRIIAAEEECTEDLFDAVNTAHVHTLLPKPCDPKTVRKAVVDAVKLYGTVRPSSQAMRETMYGTVRMLVDILELTHPAAVRRSKRIRRRARKVSEDIKAMPSKFMDMVVLLSNIGCVGLPAGLLRKVEKGVGLSKEEQQIFYSHPSIAGLLLENVPRFGKIANIIRHQNTPCSENPPLGSRILKACIDLDQIQVKGASAEKGMKFMRGKPDVYDSRVLDALENHLGESRKAVCNEITVAELEPGMVMQKDMVTEAGTVLLQKGEKLSAASHQRIQAFSDLLNIREPVCAAHPS